MKKQAGRLEEEVRHLRAPPLIVGTLQDVLDPERLLSDLRMVRFSKSL